MIVLIESIVHCSYPENTEDLKCVLCRASGFFGSRLKRLRGFRALSERRRPREEPSFNATDFNPVGNIFIIVSLLLIIHRQSL